MLNSSIFHNLEPRKLQKVLAPAYDACPIFQGNGGYGLIKIVHRLARGSEPGGEGTEDLIGIFIQIESESQMYVPC